MFARIIGTLVLALFVSMLAQAQQRTVLRGLLLDAELDIPVAAAHVLNLSDSVASITSPEGAFRISASIGDSIIFSSIGYQPKAMIVKQEELIDELLVIRIRSKNYELGEVEVNPLGSKEQFRKNFMELDLDDGTMEIRGVQGPTKPEHEIPITENADEISKAKYLFTNPLSFLYGNLSGDAKKRQRLHELEAQEERFRKNDSKFNEETVHRITDYEGDRLRAFMDYCNFSEQQIYRYSDYELTVIILNKKKEFERAGK